MNQPMILILIDDDGISIEGEGYEGNSCLAEVSKISRKLGVRGRPEKKAEYRQAQASSNTHEQQLAQ